MRLWLPPAPSSTVHTHSTEDIQQPTASLHTARQQPGNNSAPTTPCFGSHATRSLFFSTKARRFAHVWRVHALRCGRRATLQLSNTSQRSPKFAQISPGQTVLNLPSITISPMPHPAQRWDSRAISHASSDAIRAKTIIPSSGSGCISRSAAAKSYTNPARDHTTWIHISNSHIGSRFGGFFCLSHKR